MVKRSNDSEDAPQPPEEKQSSELPICGVIMPISRTAGHTAEHWASVQTLLHRCIRQAKFTPVNAWRDTANDRVSERIIGNIFKFPIFVVDISDLNPNVMFELGLRLASKKPTVVIVEKGGEVPFDLKDFHYETYPSDLNILEMEAFFKKLIAALAEKFEASKAPDYKPFLGDVVIEVVTPQVEAVSLNEAVLKQLGEISSRMSRLEAVSLSDPSASVRLKNYMKAGSLDPESRGTRFIHINRESDADAMLILDMMGYQGRLLRIGDQRVVDLGNFISPEELAKFWSEMENLKKG